ncbi:MAG: helix-turn-helix transcriptional regulator [Verrucomicrobia bacterium]|nr:helix-turn-helix transcriptional regulator [Verrucomicrobiota bacterium]
MARTLTPVERWTELAATARYSARQFAKLRNLSLRQLEREFQRGFGVTPQKWLDQQRIDVARRMLVEGQSVKWVAIELGYKQTSHFCRQFKAHNGMTASQYLVQIQQPKDVADR